MSSEAAPPPAAGEAFYEARTARFAGAARDAARPAALVANLRLLVAIVTLLLLGVAAFAKNPWIGLPVPFGVAGFALLVGWHRRLRRRLHEARAMAAVNEAAVHRLRREWDEMPAPPAAAPPGDHPYARDLDILGPASLLQLLNTTTSPMGESTLAAWLLQPAPPHAVAERQPAVRELAGSIELCQQLEAAGWAARSLPTTMPDPSPFAEWADAGPDSGPEALHWAALLSAVLLWATLLLWAVGIVPLPIWPLFLLTNAALAIGLAGRAQRTLAVVRLQQGRITPYGAQLSAFAAPAWSAALLQRLAQTAQPDGVSAERVLRRLSRIVSFSVPAGSLLNGPTQLLFLWNVHIAWLADRWRQRWGRHVPQWLQALGEVEALAALGALAHREPAWTMPVLDAGATVLEASDLGHPLLDPRTRVDNDVKLGPSGTILLVTGSNMSGKSTLLRAIGVNAVLAAAGGPVCARCLRLPPLRLWTSMRIDDSLARGVSYFLGEVLRLKLVVDGVEDGRRQDAETAPAPLACYLLDEILQGTNTAERTVAARAVLRHLAAQRGIGAVSTHDLTLAEDPSLQRAIRHVHFRETIATQDGRTTMTFDYRLRPGIATSTNALRLMAALGLPGGQGGDGGRE